MLRIIRRKLFTNKKVILFTLLYLVTVYFVASVLTDVINKYDTSRHGGTV